MLDQKSRRIQQLKGLLSQAKGKLEMYRQQIQIKDMQILELTKRLQKTSFYQQKMASLESQTDIVSKQYEVCIKEYESTLQQKEESLATLEKQNKLLITTNKNLSTNIDKLTQILAKTILKNDPKQLVSQNNELKLIYQLKQMERQLQLLSIADKSVSSLKNTLTQILTKITQELGRREQQIRILQETQSVISHSFFQGPAKYLCLNTVANLEEQINIKTSEHSKIMQIQKQEYEMKYPKQQINVEFAKNMFLKLFTGTPECVKMSLKVISNLLNLSDAQYKSIQKHLWS